MSQEPNHERYGVSSGPLSQTFNLYTGSGGDSPGNAVTPGQWKNTEFLKDMNIEIDAGGNPLAAVVQLFGSNDQNAPGTLLEASEPLTGTQIGADIDLNGNTFIQVTGGPYRFVRLGIKSITNGDSFKANMHGISS